MIYMIYTISIISMISMIYMMYTRHDIYGEYDLDDLDRDLSCVRLLYSGVERRRRALRHVQATHACCSRVAPLTKRRCSSRVYAAETREGKGGGE